MTRYTSYLQFTWFADRCGFDVPVHGKEDADYGYFLNVNASPFELNESTGFSPGNSGNFKICDTDDNVPHENPIGDQFTAAVKDLMADNFSEGKFGTIAGIDPTKDHDKRGTDSGFRCPLLWHNLEGSEGTIETEMSGEGSLSELHLGKCGSKVFERRTHLTRTDTYIVNESLDELTDFSAGVSGTENTARKALLHADTYIVDDDGEDHRFDADSFGEAGRVSYDGDEVNQWETADTGTECQGRSSYRELDTAAWTEEDTGEVDNTDAQNDLSGLQLPSSKDVLESPNVLASATAASSSMSSWKESEKYESEVGEQFMKEPNVRDSLIDIAGTEALFRGGDDKETQIESTSDCDDFKHAGVMMEADKRESVVGSVSEGRGIIGGEQLGDSKGILASAKLFTDVNDELVDDAYVQKELKCDESDTVAHTNFCEAEENKSEEIDTGIFRSVTDISKEKETVEYVTSGRAILGSGGYTFSKSDPEDDALQADCVEGQTFIPDVNREFNEPQTFLNSSSTDDYDQEKRETDFKGTTEDVERPRSGSDVVASTTLWEG